MTPTYPELHACLCFLALPHEQKVGYLGSRFRLQVFEWGEGRIETDDPLRVIMLVGAEECRRQFLQVAADEALRAIFAVSELMHNEPAVWSAPVRWLDDDRGSLGVLDVWDGLRRLALVALTDLGWPAAAPALSCRAILNAASGGRFIE